MQLYRRGEKIIDHIAEHSALSEEEVTSMQETLTRVWGEHLDQLRYGGRPYFLHQLEVTERLVYDYGILDPVAFRISIAHDTKEDRAPGYRRLTRWFQDWLASPNEQEQFNRFRLGVRSLSEINAGPISNEWAMRLKAKGLRDTLDPYLDETEAEELYFRGLVDPESVYGKTERFKRSSRYARVTSELRRQIQLIKCFDRISNWNDYPWFFDSHMDITERLANKPSRDFEKTFRAFIPYLLNAKNNLTPEDVVHVYRDLFQTLRKYATLSEDNTRAAPLRNAARLARNTGNGTCV